MRRMLSIAVAACLLLAGVAVTQATGAGGLSMSPAITEHLAQPGTVGSVEIANSTAGPLEIVVTPRPWNQARSGAIAPNRRRTLSSQVRVSASRFTLAAGARRPITLTLLRAPSAGSLFGSLEIVGTPPKPSKPRTGVLVGYRLVGSLRMTPAVSRRRLKVSLASPRVTGKGAKRAIVAALRNIGNTIDPITGSARISGARGTRTLAIAARRVVPGATVDLALGSVRGLPKGRYRARISLLQGGKPLTTSTRIFRVR
jgi:hypothetical protein